MGLCKIDIERKTGSIKARMMSDRATLESWMASKEFQDDSLGLMSMLPDSKLFPLVAIDSISPVAGSEDDLMGAFLNNVINAKNVLAITGDTGWYDSWGFTQIGVIGNDSVMMLNNY